jgi:hypothetical protein
MLPGTPGWEDARIGGPPSQVDYFISYTAADRAWAEWIAWQLEPAGCRGTGTANAAGRVPPWLVADPGVGAR